MVPLSRGRGVREVYAKVTMFPLRPGVDEIFAERFRRYYGDLFRLGARYSEDIDEADDVVQEAFWRLYHDPVVARPDREVYAWLSRVVVNLTLNATRGRRREKTRLEKIASLAKSLSSTAENELNPAEQLVRREQRIAVREVLLAMSERARTCLILRHSGLSYAEISSALLVAPGSVGTLLARAEREFAQRWALRSSHVNGGQVLGGDNDEL
ncbi:MAG TPA: sigma-70 family RNA polymerase sigma factor [Chloroflexota bacterium]|nr:sigma-70 family RNA polymerase sigma factor [Chloroflexota bacterium]